MAHHLSHAQEHEPKHKHFICPSCHGAGWVDQEPGSNQELEALKRYKDDLASEMKACENRIAKLM